MVCTHKKSNYIPQRVYNFPSKSACATSNSTILNTEWLRKSALWHADGVVGKYGRRGKFIDRCCPRARDYLRWQHRRYVDMCRCMYGVEYTHTFTRTDRLCEKRDSRKVVPTISRVIRVKKIHFFQRKRTEKCNGGCCLL